MKEQPKKPNNGKVGKNKLEAICNDTKNKKQKNKKEETSRKSKGKDEKKLDQDSESKIKTNNSLRSNISFLEEQIKYLKKPENKKKKIKVPETTKIYVKTNEKVARENGGSRGVNLYAKQAEGSSGGAGNYVTDAYASRGLEDSFSVEEYQNNSRSGLDVIPEDEMKTNIKKRDLGYGAKQDQEPDYIRKS